MTTRARSVLTSVTLITLLGSCAAPDATSQHAAAIMGGTTDSTDRNVVGILLTDNQTFAATCTGSLIAPNVVLTARHCVSPMSNEFFFCQDTTDPRTGQHYSATTAGSPYPAGYFYVTTDGTIDTTSNYVTVAQVIVPPNTTNVPACGKDLAILRLAQPINNVGLVEPRVGITPAPLEHFKAIGYGATDGQGDNVGTRRSREGLSVQYVGRLTDMTGQVYEEDAEMLADTGTCSGDSGGPAMDGLGATMGILSRGGANTCDQPTYTRVDSWAAWIRSTTHTAVASIGLPDPAWVNPPAANSANMGDPCTTDDQCLYPLQCLIVNNARICTSTECTACPAGYLCGMTSAGQGCVPDPNYVPDAGSTDQDSGTPGDTDAGTTGDTDSGTAGDTDSGVAVDQDGGTPGGTDAGATADSGPTGMGHGGCSVGAPAGDAGEALGVLALALGAAVVRRRRKRAE